MIKFKTFSNTKNQSHKEKSELHIFSKITFESLFLRVKDFVFKPWNGASPI